MQWTFIFFSFGIILLQQRKPDFKNVKSLIPIFCCPTAYSFKPGTLLEWCINSKLHPTGCIMISWWFSFFLPCVHFVSSRYQRHYGLLPDSYALQSLPSWQPSCTGSAAGAYGERTVTLYCHSMGSKAAQLS